MRQPLRDLSYAIEPRILIKERSRHFQFVRFPRPQAGASARRSRTEVHRAHPGPSLAIPPALEGRDVLQARRPAAANPPRSAFRSQRAHGQMPRGKTRALMLAPTRELAEQIAEHLTALAKYSGVRVAAIYGGVGFGAQAAAFKRGTEIIVATPGRLLDHIGQGTARLRRHRDSRPRRSRPHAGHGILAVVRRSLKIHPVAASNAVLLCDDAARDLGARERDAARSRSRVELAPKASPVEGITQTVYTVSQRARAIYCSSCSRTTHL